jgi:hypothetical protein
LFGTREWRIENPTASLWIAAVSRRPKDARLLLLDLLPRRVRIIFRAGQFEDVHVMHQFRGHMRRRSGELWIDAVDRLFIFGGHGKVLAYLKLMFREAHDERSS